MFQQKNKQCHSRQLTMEANIQWTKISRQFSERVFVVAEIELWSNARAVWEGTRCDTMVCQPVNNLVDQAGWCIGEMGRVGKEDIVDMLSALWPWNAILCFFFKSFTEIPRCKLPVQWCPQALYNGGGGLWPHTTMLFIFSLTSRDSWQQPQGLIKVTAAKCIRTQDDYQHIMFFIDAPCSLSCAQYPFRNVCVSL